MLRIHRWRSVVSVLGLVGFAVGVAVAADVGMARANGDAGASLRVAEPYREGPLDRRASIESFVWPSRSQELLALGAMAVILYGFRASGLARSERTHRRAQAVAPRPRVSTR